MKLRTRTGSLRFRLTRGEVTALAELGIVEETVDLGPAAALVYRLVTSDGVDSIRVSFEPGTAQITVELPTALARSWAASEEVGLAAVQSNAPRGPLSVLVEKDFACVKPRADEDERDAFPHPAAASGAC